MKLTERCQRATFVHCRFVSRSDTSTGNKATGAEICCCCLCGVKVAELWDRLIWFVNLFRFVKDDVLVADPGRSRGFEGSRTFRIPGQNLWPSVYVFPATSTSNCICVKNPIGHSQSEKRVQSNATENVHLPHQSNSKGRKCVLVLDGNLLCPGISQLLRYYAKRQLEHTYLFSLEPQGLNVHMLFMYNQC